MAYFTWASTSVLVSLFYLYNSYWKLNAIMNPMEGVKLVEPIIEPLWKPNQKFILIGFLAHHPTFYPFKLSELRRSKRLLIYKEDLFYGLDQPNTNLDFFFAGNNSISTLTKGNPNIMKGPDNLWTTVRENSTLMYIHFALAQAPESINGRKPKALDAITVDQLEDGHILYGITNLIAVDKSPPKLVERYLLTDENIPISMLREVSAAMNSTHAQKKITYWKTEVSLRILTDWTRYPYRPQERHPITPKIIRNEIVRNVHLTGYWYKPALYEDTIGLTADKYIPLNCTVDQLPLHISISHVTLQKCMLVVSMQQKLEHDKVLGDVETDDMRRLFTGVKSISGLSWTLVSSLVHCMLEILALEAEILFWYHLTEVAGLSLYMIWLELACQLIILLYVYQTNTNLVYIVPSAIYALVQIFKLCRYTDVYLSLPEPPADMHRMSFTAHLRWMLVIPTVKYFRYEIQQQRKQRLEHEARVLQATADALAAQAQGQQVQGPAAALTTGSNNMTVQEACDHVAAERLDEQARSRLSTVIRVNAITWETDRRVTLYMAHFLMPVAIGYMGFTLITQKQLSWGQWLVSSLMQCIYCRGLVLAIPQLYINYNIRHVMHMPWTYLEFKCAAAAIDAPIVAVLSTVSLSMIQRSLEWITSISKNPQKGYLRQLKPYAKNADAIINRILGGNKFEVNATNVLLMAIVILLLCLLLEGSEKPKKVTVVEKKRD